MPCENKQSTKEKKRQAAAIYEPDTQPVGPAVFCSLHPVKSGEGKSQQRQQKFIEATNEVE
ncbi:hypothetical protein [Anabaena sp. UHCC 0451]|uniref:hypothetical protein n=1 Tax=Anabaena sp. UHCC 0451 TaxID=2055235 RepID=UPI002B20A29C|nr:hypothetical protein [Anabaena sp. UHCC 0451]MEA5579284.1 hypothetical protein [Anabaena sp. UHCC 0451]